MTTRDEIIAFAKASLKKDVIYHRDGIELEWNDLIDFYHAAQRQAYERAADELKHDALNIFHHQEGFNEETLDAIEWYDASIRALIEGDSK